jgi:hypothetical protein
MKTVKPKKTFTPARRHKAAVNKRPALRARHWEAEKDYPMVCEWWARHGVPAVALGRLPACGLIVEADGVPVLAAWLYQDNSCGMAWLGWFVGNPARKGRVVALALPVLLGAADAVMRSQKRHTLIVMTDKHGLGRALERFGYEKAHPATEYWRVL